MPGLPLAPVSPPDSPVSPSSSEEGDGPRFGTVPDLPDMPTSPGWGIVDDGGAAPAIAQVLPFPEGSTRALAPAVRYYDIEEHRHRLWQAVLHPDRPVVEGNTCSFPDFLVYAVEQERDELLVGREVAMEQDQILRQAIDGQQTDLLVARAERDVARLTALDAQMEVTRGQGREVALKEEVEFAEGQYRSILEERGLMVTQARSQ